MFAVCTIQYDTKKFGEICVLVEKQILIIIIISSSSSSSISSSSSSSITKWVLIFYLNCLLYNVNETTSLIFWSLLKGHVKVCFRGKKKQQTYNVRVIKNGYFYTGEELQEKVKFHFLRKIRQ